MKRTVGSRQIILFFLLWGEDGPQNKMKIFHSNISKTFMKYIIHSLMHSITHDNGHCLFFRVGINGLLSVWYELGSTTSKGH